MSPACVFHQLSAFPIPWSSLSSPGAAAEFGECQRWESFGSELQRAINLLFPAKVQLWKKKGDSMGFTEGAGAGKSVHCEEREWLNRQPGGDSWL